MIKYTYLCRKLNDMAKTITYFSQKGGCGKTTLSIMTASYLAYIEKKRVAVIDADGQHSFYLARQKEQKKEEFFLEELQKYEITEPYEVFECTLGETRDKLVELYKSNYDYIIVDLPGTVGDKEIYNIVCCINYVIVPFEHHAPALESSLRSAVVVTKKLKDMPGVLIKKVCGVFNKVPYSQLGKLIKYVQAINMVGFDYVFKQVIGDAPTISNIDKCCTYLPPAEQFLAQKDEKLNLGGYFEELMEVLS